MSEIDVFNATDANNNGAPPEGLSDTNTISQVDDTIRAIMGKLKRWYSDISLITTAGSANAYTIAPSRTIAALAAGDSFRIKIHEDNTGASTLQVDALSAVSIKTARVRDPQPGLLKTGGIYDVTYDGTQFILVGVDNTHSVGVTFLGATPTTASGYGYFNIARQIAGNAAGDYQITSSITWADSDAARRAIQRGGSLVSPGVGSDAISIAWIALGGTNTIRVRTTDISGTPADPTEVSIWLDIP